jgi:hypothetical protein
MEIELEKERLTNILSTQYSQSLIAMDEYERLLDFINKIETNKEIEYIKKIIDTNETYTLKEIALNKNQVENRSKKSFLEILANIFTRRKNIKTIKIYSGVYELRLYDMDFIENRLIVKIKNYGGDAFIYIEKIH